jgi:hypothetical protein
LNLLWRHFIWIKWRKVTKEIIEEELIPLIKRNGFPGEKLIGLDEKWMHYKSKNDRYNSTFCYLIFIHYFSVKNKNFNNLLIEELKRGNLSPKYYASMNDFIVKYGKGYSNNQHFNQWHRNLELKNREKINENRVLIGLETFEELQLKEKRGSKFCREQHLKMKINLWHRCG